MTRPSRLEAPSAAIASIGVLLATSAAYGQSGGEVTQPPTTASTSALTSTSTSVSPESVEQIRDELRESLLRELREELREELLGEIEAARGAPLEPAPAPIEDDTWAEEGWKWLEPERPELDLIELDGYFRFRYDFFNELDLGTYYVRAEPNRPLLEQGPVVPGLSQPVPLCDTDVRERAIGREGDTNFSAGADSCFNRAGESNSLGGANIRFRLEPTLNVYEDIKIKSQIDILDNLVLGSTPDSLYSPLSPLAALSNTQIEPSAGVTSVLRDSIRVKRVWAEIMTPLGQLSFGRMPNHVGMGITANDGNGLDMDFGDTVDRLMFAAKIGDFIVAPAFDWAATGPTSANLLSPQGQPFDRDQRDDVDQYVLTVSKTDSSEEAARKLANQEVVFDFGGQLMFRVQALDSQVVDNPVTPGEGTPDPGIEGQARSSLTRERDANIWMYTVWAKVQYEKFTLSAEYSGIVGSIGESGPVGIYDSPSRGRIDLNQHGGAVRGTYKLLNDAMTLELLVLAASGDDAPGWGVYPLLGDGTTVGAWDGNQAPVGDDTISNFRFDPDFIVDLIFWRQLVGLVTDALVIRPSVEYKVTDQLGARLDVIYSRSWFGESTPSGSFAERADNVQGGFDENLGVEADVTLFYRSKEGFNAQIQYGIFIPMDGLDRQVRIEENQLAFDNTSFLVTPDGNEPVARLDAQIAHTIQVLFAVTF